jgi:hypothetical protein
MLFRFALLFLTLQLIVPFQTPVLDPKARLLLLHMVMTSATCKRLLALAQTSVKVLKLDSIKPGTSITKG